MRRRWRALFCCYCYLRFMFAAVFATLLILAFDAAADADAATHDAASYDVSSLATPYRAFLIIACRHHAIVAADAPHAAPSATLITAASHRSRAMLFFFASFDATILLLRCFALFAATPLIFRMPPDAMLALATRHDIFRRFRLSSAPPPLMLPSYAFAMLTPFSMPLSPFRYYFSRRFFAYAACFTMSCSHFAFQAQVMLSQQK